MGVVRVMNLQRTCKGSCGSSFPGQLQAEVEMWVKEGGSSLHKTFRKINLEHKYTNAPNNVKPPPPSPERGGDRDGDLTGNPHPTRGGFDLSVCYIPLYSYPFTATCLRCLKVQQQPAQVGVF